MTDILLINPGSKKRVFQGLGSELAAVEPPFWIAVIASYLRGKGFNVSVIDSNAENYSPGETAEIVKQHNPLLAAVIVYGSQPSASTQNMPSSGEICKAIKESTDIKVAIGGLHPSALPERTLKEEAVDFVIDGEGIFTIEDLLQNLKNDSISYNEIKGLWWLCEENKIIHTERYPIIDSLDNFLPQPAWDLLPMEKYRAHNWHCFDDIDNRKPYGVIYTSLGCPYNCTFCCINAPFGKHTIRYHSCEKVLRDIETLVHEYNVKNIKIADELFILNKNHYESILEGIIERNLDLNMWAYARVDTIDFKLLPKLKKAGINWLALGIESANRNVSRGVSKQTENIDIPGVISAIQDSGIYVIGNYIFGLPEDNFESMNETLALSMELNCEFANFYCTMAYPGSELYNTAVKNNQELPDSWNGYSQHSYDTKPLASKYLSAKEILKFRDDAYIKYFTNTKYLGMITEKFGIKVAKHLKEMTKIKLKRKLLGDYFFEIR